jgi:hypothetical protein
VKRYTTNGFSLRDLCIYLFVSCSFLLIPPTLYPFYVCSDEADLSDLRHFILWFARR